MSEEVKIIIEQESYRTWRVIEETPDDIKEYFVRTNGVGWKCSCLASIYRKNCHHITAVKEYLFKSRGEKNE